MASTTRQHLLNALASELEKNGVRVTHLETGGDPQTFDEKYRRLPKPPSVGGHVPDLRGVDKTGVIHLGEAETSASGSEPQLLAFAHRVMPGTGAPVPLHVIVPFEYTESMKNTMRRIGLGSQIGSRIRVWFA